MRDVALRNAVASDEDGLWLMLFYASHSHDDAEALPDDVRADPDLVRYVAGWGRAGDMGVIAESDGDICGAAWLRLFTEGDRGDVTYVDARTPELAVAVLPGLEGSGTGTAMLTKLFDLAKPVHRAIVLSVREGNPAVSLYERLGFRAVDDVTNRVGTRSIKMVLDLT
jgi:GNAT superfamily N-acetyltransferase